MEGECLNQWNTISSGQFAMDAHLKFEASSSRIQASSLNALQNKETNI